MSIVEDSAIEPTSSPIDRLSLLPNELLHDIFESVYSSTPPQFPLSKHLYPFFEEHFYRRVHLFSPHQVKRFLKTISAHPDRGKSVKSLEFDRKKGRVVKSLDILEALFPLLPSLVHLEIKADSIEVGIRSKNLFSSLVTVKSVSTVTVVNEAGYIDFAYFAFLSALPSLSDLEVYEWPDDAEPYLEEEEAFQLPHVETLRIEGEGADLAAIKVIVDLCPVLLSIDLETEYTDDLTHYEFALNVLPSTIHSLKLGSSYSSIEPRDHLLRRFTQLRALDLDKDCYSKEIHTTLAVLPFLVSIRLGHGSISPSGFLDLVSGPTRLVNLKQITLDFAVGSWGRRISYETRSDFEEEDEMDDWKLSEDIEDGEDEQDEYVVKLVQLVLVAESNGVEVRGTVHEALALVKDYWIEASNRAILSLQSRSEEQELIQEDFNRLRDIRQSAATNRVSLPQLDIDSLNRTQLELAKTDLPERNCFMYSLKNEGRGVSDE